MRVVAISDLHGYLPEDLPECEIILIGGDLCPVNDHTIPYQANWLIDVFNPWLADLKPEVVCVAGNHDFVFERAKGLVPKLNCHYLENQSVEIKGLKIWGSPWSMKFNNWAFGAIDSKLADIWTTIPDDTDIIVVHGPPHNMGDRVEEGLRTGSISLVDRIDQVKPALVVCGHIHEDHGIFEWGTTIVANASLRDRAYNPLAFEPMIFEISDGPVCSVISDGVRPYGYGAHYLD